MAVYEYVSPCHFGLEAVLKREITDLGFEIVSVEDGRVTYRADEAAAARANIFLRTTERVLLLVAKFKAETFDELFEKTKALPWEDFIPRDGKFWVAKAASVKSKLFIPGAIFAAIMAASMGIVPLPQNGSISIRSLFHGVSISSAAARFSAMGAFAVSFL